jgi:endonuclease III
MSEPNRAALINKLYKALKAHYKPVAQNGDRPLLQHMLYACCLENTHYDKAQKVYEHVSTSFFDWNEVRVSTVKELAEAMRELPDPPSAAANLKSILQNVFEATYSFDLESVKKQNIGVGIKRLAKFEGASPFVVAYATQHALGGHSIPLDKGALDVLYIIGIASEAERKSGAVGGLERAIPKNKGTEFGSLLHQLAADYMANPFSPNMKNLFLEINPQAKERLPKRGQKKVEVHELRAKDDAKASKDGKAGGPPPKHAGEKTQKHQEKLIAAKHEKDAHRKGASAKAAIEPGRKKPIVKQPAAAKASPHSHKAAAAHASRGSARKSEIKRLAKRKPR